VALYRDLHYCFRPRARDVREQLPVDKGSCGYAARWNTFKRIAAGYSAGEKAGLFAGTVAKFYRLV